MAKVARRSLGGNADNSVGSRLRRQSRSQRDANEIRIGASMELTGGVAAYGQQTLNGIKLAVKQ